VNVSIPDGWDWTRHSIKWREDTRWRGTSWTQGGAALKKRNKSLEGCSNKQEGVCYGTVRKYRLNLVPAARRKLSKGPSEVGQIRKDVGLEGKGRSFK